MRTSLKGFHANRFNQYIELAPVCDYKVEVGFLETLLGADLHAWMDLQAASR
jgi:hypothetical protein